MWEKCHNNHYKYNPNFNITSVLLRSKIEWKLYDGPKTHLIQNVRDVLDLSHLKINWTIYIWKTVLQSVSYFWQGITNLAAIEV